MKLLARDKNRVPKLKAASVQKSSEPSWSVSVQLSSRFALSIPQYDSLANTLSRSRVITASLKRSILRSAAQGYDIASKAGRKATDHTAILLNAVLASNLSHSMETWTKSLVEGMPTVYDKAMDQVYNSTNIGGGQLHRLLDGSHDLVGAWKAIHNARSDDSLFQEAMGYFSGLWNDLWTPVGLPIKTLSKDQYGQFAGFLNDKFSIPRSWSQDILHINGVELFGASVGAIAVALHWKRKDVKRFSTLCGSLGVSALVSANPMLGVLATAGLAKSFADARNHGGDYAQFVNGLAKGGIGTGVLLGTAGVVGGPAFVGLLAGFCMGIAAHKVLNTVEPSQIAEFLVSSAKSQFSTQSTNLATHPSSSPR